MPRPATDKRDRLADAALDLTYRRGFERTSIADIAEHAGVAPGSVYYYFKTKDDVGQAIVDTLSGRYLSVIEGWRDLAAPEDRLVSFLDMYLDDADNVRAFGCPLGAVCAELGRHSPELGAAAGEVFSALIDWAAGEFAELGFAEAAARARATHLIAVMQGAAALTHALDDPEPLQREAAHLERWIRRAGE
ncbi:TetR/AcrR family transcriptional regulator [Demequina lutea]|uniref:AcrR family transcriptional regulator n=1 Tax=Demequina lutea TaxID=431489 RepID=A0A7Z0CLE8_9MICO|nr:TetR/AcrR family transcriptional regulator [Demequina lutea]NYI42690.1 AcrR family transcriptional regulator [Demequina lutea]